MENEIWSNCYGFDGYQASNIGRVRSIDKIVNCRAGKRLRKGKILSPSLNWFGYQQYILYKDGKPISKSGQRIVWEAFNGQIPEGMQVNHINEVKTDNRLENLNLMTPKENCNWGTGIKRCSRKKEKPITQYFLDGTPFFTFFSSKDAAQDMGISYSSINNCLRGLSKTAGAYKWKYATPHYQTPM